MIYTEVDDAVREEMRVLGGESQKTINEIERLTVVADKEDSKSREKAMREEIVELKTKNRQLSNRIAQVRETAFKKLLAEEYGVAGNPRFEKCYDIAYSYGHSSGYSDVENYFSTLVDLIR